MLERQGFACAVSGRPLAPETAALDHIMPLGRGGAHSLENVWIVHHQINAAKGTLTLDEFTALCRDVVNHQAHTGGTRQ